MKPIYSFSKVVLDSSKGAFIGEEFTLVKPKENSREDVQLIKRIEINVGLAD